MPNRPTPSKDSPTIRINNYTFVGTDLAELHSLKQEIFTHHSYYIELSTTSPTILDIGAHIGITSAYFAYLFPEAQITAVEPHPLTFELLKRNIEANFLTQVTPIQAAVTTQKLAQASPTTQLHADPTAEWLSTASLISGGWDRQQTTEIQRVPTLSFSDLLSKRDHWDIVKMDVEGTEKELLMESPPELERVATLLVEIHDWSKETYANISQKLLARGLKITDSADFNYRERLNMLIFAR